MPRHPTPHPTSHPPTTTHPPSFNLPTPLTAVMFRRLPRLVVVSRPTLRCMTSSTGGSTSDESTAATANADMVEFRHVAVAAANIKDRIAKTPCQKSLFLSQYLGIDCYLKKELFQQTGSFKERGALNRLLNLSDEQKKEGVVAASAGNHALVRACSFFSEETIFILVHSSVLGIQNTA